MSQSSIPDKKTVELAHTSLDVIEGNVRDMYLKGMSGEGLESRVTNTREHVKNLREYIKTLEELLGI
jgi:hypothetical protein